SAGLRSLLGQSHTLLTATETSHWRAVGIACPATCWQDRMNTDNIFHKPGAPVGDFAFDASVAEVFDDMLLRSVPFYVEQQRMIVEIARTFWLPGTHVFDLGCSTATTLIHLAQALEPSARLVGYDNSKPMLNKAARTVAERDLSDRIELRHADLNGDPVEIALVNASVVTLCWTLQFVRPLKRDRLVGWIYDSLLPRGALIVTEKVLSIDSSINRSFIDFYYDFKSRRHYSEVEISRKREALENVLIPYRTDENAELFRRNGFEIVEPFFQWYNFVGFLCVKGAR
ncbi:MAG: carboxy-S-adenosyl-L-methionine synthase CmoA, partial [Gemmatimonadales bacterium]